jgi:hypothetical protein
VGRKGRVANFSPRQFGAYTRQTGAAVSTLYERKNVPPYPLSNLQPCSKLLIIKAGCSGRFQLRSDSAILPTTQPFCGAVSAGMLIHPAVRVFG